MSLRKSSQSAAPGVAKLRLSADARADLAEIDSYGAMRFGDEAAAIYSRGFNKVWARLREYPFSAPPRNEFGEGIRCFIHRSHRVLYRVEGETVQIARILHYSRDVGKALRL